MALILYVSIPGQSRTVVEVNPGGTVADILAALPGTPEGASVWFQGAALDLETPLADTGMSNEAGVEVRMIPEILFSKDLSYPKINFENVDGRMVRAGCENCSCEYAPAVAAFRNDEPLPPTWSGCVTFTTVDRKGKDVRTIWGVFGPGYEKAKSAPHLYAPSSGSGGFYGLDDKGQMWNPGREKKGFKEKTGEEDRWNKAMIAPGCCMHMTIDRPAGTLTWECKELKAVGTLPDDLKNASLYPAVIVYGKGTVVEVSLRSEGS